MDHPDVPKWSIFQVITPRLPDTFDFSYGAIWRLWARIIGCFFQENLRSGQFWPYFEALEYARDPHLAQFKRYATPGVPNVITCQPELIKTVLAAVMIEIYPKKMDFLPN